MTNHLFNAENRELAEEQKACLWREWIDEHLSEIEELKLPAGSMGDFSHLYDFVFNYPDVYEIDFYDINSLSRKQFAILLNLLQSFYEKFRELDEKQKECLWRAWVNEHLSEIEKLKFPAGAMVDFSHFSDFVFNYSDVYEIEFYDINSLSKKQIITLFNLLESFFENGNENERLLSAVYRDLLKLYDFNYYGNEIPSPQEFIKKVKENNV